jgi:hypothetical protein
MVCPVQTLIKIFLEYMACQNPAQAFVKIPVPSSLPKVSSGWKDGLPERI